MLIFQWLRGQIGAGGSSNSQPRRRTAAFGRIERNRRQKTCVRGAIIAAIRLPAFLPTGNCHALAARPRPPPRLLDRCGRRASALLPLARETQDRVRTDQPGQGLDEGESRVREVGLFDLADAFFRRPSALRSSTACRQWRYSITPPPASRTATGSTASAVHYVARMSVCIISASVDRVFELA